MWVGRRWRLIFGKISIFTFHRRNWCLQFPAGEGPFEDTSAGEVVEDFSVCYMLKHSSGLPSSIYVLLFAFDNRRVVNLTRYDRAAYSMISVSSNIFKRYVKYSFLVTHSFSRRTFSSMMAFWLFLLSNIEYENFSHRQPKASMLLCV